MAIENAGCTAVVDVTVVVTDVSIREFRLVSPTPKGQPRGERVLVSVWNGR
jgi:hypothetical protein